MFGRYQELGDFILEPFKSELKETEDGYRLKLTRRGRVWKGDFSCPVKMEKMIIFPKRGNEIIIRYRILQHDLEILPIKFGVEFDFNLLAPDAEDRYAVIDGARPKTDSHLAAVGETDHVNSIAWHDEYQQLGISIESDLAGKLWRLPIYTVSLSEGGFEKVFQGNCSMFVFEKALAAGEVFEFSFKLFVGPRAKMPAYKKSEPAAANKT